MRKQVRPSLILALVSFVVLIVVILWGTAFSKLPPILPLIAVAVLACLLGKYLGYSWKELQEGMFDSVSRVMAAMILLILVGMLIGIWILSGTIPMFIYWGLELISPSSFLVTTFFLCVLASTLTGTSFGTMGTMGVALLGVGQAMGYPLPMVVGAIVSGAYFGDKVSPVSSSTNITASICEVELFSHISSMMWTTLPTVVVTAIIYVFLGMQHSGAAVSSNIPALLTTIKATYNLSWWTLVPPIIMLVFAYRRYPAIPLISLCIAAGAIVAWLLQGQSLAAIANSMANGYTSKTGLAQLDSLLSRGGITSVMSTIMLLIAAVSFGGVIEKIKILEVLVEATVKWANNTGRLITAVLLSGYIMLIGTGSQMVTIVIPSRAFAQVFKERNLHPRVLSRTVEDSGVIASPLLPWGVHAFYILGILGVSPYLYAPYAFMCWIVPIFSIPFAYLGIAIWRSDGSSVRLPLNTDNEAQKKG
jgi:Na+:H+ antiporter, NhaC family